MSGVSQLRIYTINKEKMDEFVKGWSELIYPLRLKHGFRVDGAWMVKDQNKFVWILSYDVADEWEAKNKVYYESPERKAIDPDPGQHIAHMETYFISPVFPKLRTGKTELPLTPDERLETVRHLIIMSHHEMAREILLEYLKDNPKDADAWYLVGQAAADNTEAISALQTALELNPDHEDASVLLASLKGDAEIITYPTRPDVNLEELAAKRKAERDEKSEEDKKE